MFDGEQFHQFIAPRTSFPLHAASATNFPPPLDPYNLSLSHLQPGLLHHHSPTHKEDNRSATATAVSMNFHKQVRNEHNLTADNSWTNDEVLALLKIRSTMETWFPDLTWEHVSRKLAELGFKRSADRCKEKFEEESRYFNNNINYTKNYRFLSEFEELYQSDHHQNAPVEEVGKEKIDRLLMEKPTQQVEGQDKNMDHMEDSRNGKQHFDTDKTEKVTVEKSKDGKRKRHDKFEMFKDLCENIVNQMMAQQEEMHNKLLRDMLKRDEDKFAREEAWKKRDMDMMNKELDMMAQEQAVAGDRQAAIIEFLKKFAAGSPIAVGSQREKGNNLTVTNTSNINPTTPITSFQLHPQNPSRKKDLGSPPFSTMIPNHQNITCSAENPSSSLFPETIEVAASSSTSTPTPPQNNPLATTSASTHRASSAEKEDVGRRWPRDEVMALINLRSCLNNSGEDGSNKAPLWERMSQGMLELGYKRSAKRCKEKWENINKYFRKTKDNVNKKRSLDSRTCPYFHQLSTLYGQGKLVSQSERIDQNHLNPSPTNQGQVHTDGGEKTLMQGPAALDFEF
ncbi:hypothetical protein L6164_010578 [Bauhinia variegata]|uniref:Uncharacterized protein n=1 Tax=Bauhinia variegata TaxID=167791 RepID=A0ACB9PN99_BAUVA|nr:hypothetical protein L6164_010578 [Bauhinia variegata]